MKAMSFPKIVIALALLICSYYVRAQSDSDSTQLPPRNWDIVPMISSSPEMGLLLGINPIFSFTINPSDSLLRHSFVSAELFGTFKKQFGASGQGSLLFRQNNYQLNFSLNATLNQWRYYGVGNEIDLEQYDTYRFRAYLPILSCCERLCPTLIWGWGIGTIISTSLTGKTMNC